MGQLKGRIGMFEGFTKRTIDTSGARINLVQAGNGPPLLLLHGYPQTHVMWRKVAPQLAQHFTVIATDLRGYGDSSKPADGDNHFGYSKRAMAQDQVEVMAALGFERFMVAGHDRGARVTHRLALDHADKVTRAAVLDIVPTLTVFDTVDQRVATAYFHWFFLIQPDDFPERMIGNDPDYYLTSRLTRWGSDGGAFEDEAVKEYLRCFRDPASIHATCEDYRAGASIDLKFDREDLSKKVTCPLLVLWGGRGLVAKAYDVLAVWGERARDVRGKALDCGHFIPEELPQETFNAFRDFFLAK
jgi:haloacetate dehalogenase